MKAKKILGLVTSILLTAACLAGEIPRGKSVQAREKVIDMYLVAGQSNASGFSKCNTISKNRMKDVYQLGFENVISYGLADSRSFLDFTLPVMLGQGGFGNQYFGPEVGMAEAITRYSECEESIIVKTAYGGSGLVDCADSRTHAVGNWTSPSMRTSSADPNKTGVNYDHFISTIESAVSHYEKNGYTVKLKGTFWMQGEAETTSSEKIAVYGDCLTALINDLRADYAEFFDATEAQTAPFIIGKVGPTFMGEANRTGNEGIRSAQETVANTLENVYCIETEDYVIVDPTTDAPAEGCHDRFHFSGNDMLSLGYEAGRAILVNNVKNCLEVTVSKGGKSSVDFVRLNGEPVSVTFTPDKYYYLSKLTLNGEDITDKAVNGTYVFSGTTGINYLTGEFEKLGQYPLTIETDEERGKLSRDPVLEKYYAGTEIKLTPKPKSGYKLKKLTFNGEELIAVGGVYKIKIVNGENKLIAEWEEASVSGGSSSGGNNMETPPTEPQKTEKSSCRSSVGVGALAGIVSAAAILSVYAAKKKRK